MSETLEALAETRQARGKTDVILDAAQQLFAQFGYRRTVMDDIAREAGVAKGTLYLYFDSKEAVFRAMHARTLEDLGRLYDSIERAPLPFAERLYQLLDMRCGALQERYARSEHLLELDATRATVSADMAEAAEAAYRDRLIRTLQTADGAGEIDLKANGLTAVAMVDTIMAATTGAKRGPQGPLDLDSYRLRLRDIVAISFAAVRPR